MKTLEQQINQYLEVENWTPIENWAWKGWPESDWQPFDNYDYKVNRIQSAVDGMIRHANEVECLTSFSQYIRELKLWINKHQNYEW